VILPLASCLEGRDRRREEEERERGEREYREIRGERRERILDRETSLISLWRWRV